MYVHQNAEQDGKICRERAASLESNVLVILYWGGVFLMYSN